MDQPVIVARIARAHGIKGGLLLDAETDAPEALFQTGRRLRVVGATGGPAEIEIATARPHGERWLVTVEGVVDRTTAELLRGAKVTVPRSELPDLGDDGLLLYDLIGMTVAEGERELGQVRDVYDMPAGPMLSVEVDGKEQLIPFDPAFVVEVDVAQLRVTVELPEGLLDL